MNAILRLHTKFRWQEYASYLPQREIVRSLRLAYVHNTTIYTLKSPCVWRSLSHSRSPFVRSAIRDTHTHTQTHLYTNTRSIREYRLFHAVCCLCPWLPQAETNRTQIVQKFINTQSNKPV